MFPISDVEFDNAVKRLGIMDVAGATIRQICGLAHELEQSAGEPMIHLEIGNPGLDAESIGVEAEIEASARAWPTYIPPSRGCRASRKPERHS